MKRICVALIGLMTFVLSGPAFAVTPYQHETALCAAIDSRHPSPSVLQKLGKEFFEQQDVRSVSDSPLIARETFVKGNDDRVFILSRWYGLSAQRSYTFLCEWTNPDGDLYQTSSASFRTPEYLDPSVFFTYTASRYRRGFEGGSLDRPSLSQWRSDRNKRSSNHLGLA